MTLILRQQYQDSSGEETQIRLPDGFTIIGNLRLRNDGGVPQRRVDPDAPWLDVTS